MPAKPSVNGKPLTDAQLAMFGVEPRRIWKGGYATQPGTGPENETCRSCLHILLFRTPAGRPFQKCDIVRDGPCSASTDIAMRAPACRYWEKTPEGGRVRMRCG